MSLPFNLSSKRVIIIMDAIIIDGSDNDAEIIEDQANPKKRAKCGRSPSDVWNEIIPVNPGPNGEQ